MLGTCEWRAINRSAARWGVVTWMIIMQRKKTVVWFYATLYKCQLKIGRRLKFVGLLLRLVSRADSILWRNTIISLTVPSRERIGSIRHRMAYFTMCRPFYPRRYLVAVFELADGNSHEFNLSKWHIWRIRCLIDKIWCRADNIASLRASATNSKLSRCSSGVFHAI